MIVKAASLIEEDGGNQDWCWANDLIAYDKLDDTGTHQLFTCKPDGSEKTCLSTGFRPDRHHVAPTWRPDGSWVVCQVEHEKHILDSFRGDVFAELVINGVSCELFATTPDGSAWRRLTYTKWPNEWGHMAPHFSYDGRYLLWSKMTEPANKFAGRPWGRYRLMLAEFAIGRLGNPYLKGVRDITPSGAVFIESHGFSPDGARVLFTSDLNSVGVHDMNLFDMGLDGSLPHQLTASKYWDEHGGYTSDGKSIVYMAGELGIGPLTGDLMLMDIDGANKRRLTAFNRVGSPGYTGDPTMVMRPSFNRDGTKMAATAQLAIGYPGRRRLWVLELGR